MVTGAITGLNDTANEFNSIRSRLNLITNDQNNAVALNQQIYESAMRARGGYMQMAEATTQLAMSAHDAFPDPREAVGFMEGIQKLFVIGGASKENQKSAMLQLTQGMASGQLQGDEFRSIAENAPIIENMIAKTMGVSRGELKKLASEGKVTSAVIKQSIMENMDEINGQFEAMPKTFGDHMESLKNRAIYAFTPVFERMRDLGNSEVMARMFDGIANTIERVAPFFYWLVGVAEWAMSGITTAFGAVSDFLSENFGIVEVAFGIAVGVLTYYATMTLISAANTAVMMASTAAATVATWASTAAKIAETYAQEGLNAALYACPITWIVGGIIALIGVFYLAVSAVNYFAGTSISATGIIFGAFAWLWGGIRNIFTFVWNLIASVANFLGNVFNDPLNATYNLFADIWNGIVDFIASAVSEILSLIKKIPGMDKIMGDTTVNAGALHIERKAIAGGETTLLGKMDYVNQMDYASAGYKMGENLFNFEMPTPTIPDYKAKEMEGA